MKRSRSGSHLLPAAPPTIHLIELNDEINGAHRQSPCSTASTPSILMSPTTIHPATGGSDAATAGVHGDRSGSGFVHPTAPSIAKELVSVCSSRRRLSSNDPISEAVIAQKPKRTTPGYDAQLVHAAAANSGDDIGGWPYRCYGCNFCGREFKSAQALGGHMNIHRRDRARLRTTLHDLQLLAAAPADYAETATMSSPHGAAAQNSSLVAKHPLSVSVAEYPIIMQAPIRSLDVMLNRPHLRSPFVVSARGEYLCDQSSQCLRLQHPIMSMSVHAAAASFQPAASTTSFPDPPLQRTTSSGERQCLFDSCCGRSSASLQSCSPGIMTSYVSRRMGDDPSSHAIAVPLSPPGHSSSRSLDLELRLGQSSTPAAVSRS